MTSERAAGEGRAVARFVCSPEDGHHWVSSSVNGRLMAWVIQCSICEEFNVEEMDRDIAVRIATPSPVSPSPQSSEGRDEWVRASVEAFDRAEALTHALLRGDRQWADALLDGDPNASPTPPAVSITEPEEQQPMDDFERQMENDRRADLGFAPIPEPPMTRPGVSGEEKNMTTENAKRPDWIDQLGTRLRGERDDARRERDEALAEVRGLCDLLDEYRATFAANERQAAAPAAGSETREEWGVRYGIAVVGELAEKWCDTEVDRDEVASLRRREGYDVETATRTVTTTPWTEVPR